MSIMRLSEKQVNNCSISIYTFLEPSSLCRTHVFIGFVISVGKTIAKVHNTRGKVVFGTRNVNPLARPYRRIRGAEAAWLLV
jgi:hypothetical protein